MAKYGILILGLFLSFSTLADPVDLINFDQVDNKRYFKSHSIISAYLNKEFNFEQERNNNSVYYLNDVISNFSPDQIENFFLRIKYENWIFDWMKQNQHRRLYFSINNNTGIPKLMGYSDKKLDINELAGDHSTANIELTDYTNMDLSSIEKDTYIVGTLNPDFNKIYPFVHKRAIVLGYPSDLKWRNIDAYVGTYKLNRPISVPLIHAILSNKVHQIVLKKVGDHYEISGYIRPAHLERPVE